MRTDPLKICNQAGVSITPVLGKLQAPRQGYLSTQRMKWTDCPWSRMAANTGLDPKATARRARQILGAKQPAGHCSRTGVIGMTQVCKHWKPIKVASEVLEAATTERPITRLAAGDASHMQRPPAPTSAHTRNPRTHHIPFWVGLI